MKLLFYLPFLPLGGLERVISNVAKMFADRGYAVTFITDCVCEHEYEMGNNVKRIDLGISTHTFLRHFTACVKLRASIKEEKPDAILVFAPGPSSKIMLANLFIDVPVIISQRNEPILEAEKLFRKTVFKYIYPLAAGCVFQTAEARNYFPEKLKRKSTIIDNLLDIRFFETERLRDKRGIVGVGRLIPQKNWCVAIRAFHMIADLISEDFVIYSGLEEDREALQRYIDELHLTGRVILAGLTTEIEKALAGTKLFVMSSDHEGVPNALMEALAMGVPCVSTRFDGGGAERLIESGVNGLLVPKGDADALAQAMLKLLTDSDYAEQLAANAKHRAREELHPDRVFKRWEEYILSVVREYRKLHS